MGGSGAAKRRGKEQQRPKSSASSLTSPKGVSGINPSTRAQALQGWQSWQDPNTQSNAFSLSQEARNTERHTGGWASATRLRDNAIQFVSAGTLGMEKQEAQKEDIQEDPTAENAVQPTLNDPVPVEAVDAKAAIKYPTSTEMDVSMAPDNPWDVETNVKAPSHNTIIDQVGRMEIAPRSSNSSPASVEDAARLTRSTSISSATSSQDIVIFAGRKGTSAEQKVKQVAKPAMAEDTWASENIPPPAEVQSTPAPTYPLPAQTLLNDSSRQESPNPSRQSHGKKNGKTRRRRGGRRGRPQQEIEDEEEALIQDYIDNMKDDESSDEIPGKTEHYRLFHGTGEEHVKVQVASSRLGKEIAEDLEDVDDDLDWSSCDLEDFNDLSTTDDEIAEVGRVYSRRQRPAGVQYLVTAVGTDLSEAKWILEADLTSVNAAEQILIYEENLKFKLTLAQDHEVDSSSTDSEAEALDDVLDDMQSEDEENERILKRVSKMSDEELAIMLSKQEELGITGDNVQLFNGQVNYDSERGDDFVPFSSKTHLSSRTKSKRNQRKRDTFPSAEAFADALDQDPYGGFDVMDFERPSLKPKAKGRKSTGLPFELEDQDLERQILQSWSNDRTKKSEKKKEREEMRQAGLLGSKAANGRVDLQTKYKNSGMDAEQVKTEIRTFLMQEIEALALAPMEAHMRASVHRLAKALQLKSHSQGAGDDRFPILTKTSYTPKYTPSTIWAIDDLLSRRKFFLKGGPVSYKGGSNKNRSGGAGGSKARRTGGGGVIAGASYMDGEVVGASAPEIGAENRGRAMLEKMGWTTGMGIGKVGNEGRTEVVKHIVKNTKAGLG